MDNENMRNIVILKDLPSNLVEEAIVVLKDTSKVKVKKTENVKKEKSKDNRYVIKEAEMIISDYIKNMEKKKEVKEKDIHIKNYKRMKWISLGLGITTLVSLSICLF